MGIKPVTVELTESDISILVDLLDMDRCATDAQLRESYSNPNMRFYFQERLTKVVDLMHVLNLALDPLEQGEGGDDRA